MPVYDCLVDMCAKAQGLTKASVQLHHPYLLQTFGTVPIQDIHSNLILGLPITLKALKELQNMEQRQHYHHCQLGNQGISWDGEASASVALALAISAEITSVAGATTQLLSWAWHSHAPFPGST